MQTRVQSAALPFISCFAPHMASLTSPVKVWLLPAASAGTAASPTSICIPRTAVAIRLAFPLTLILLSAPVKRVDISKVHSPSLPQSRSHCHDADIKILAQASAYMEILLLLETDLHVDSLVLRFQRFMDADGPPHA